MARILFTDDEEVFRASASEFLREGGHDVRECSAVPEAIKRLEQETFDVVLVDLRLPGRNGIELLREAAARMPDGILMVLTAYGSLDTAIEALQIGAHDYLLKPINLEVLLSKINLFARHQRTLAENRFLRQALEVAQPASGLVGASSAIQEVQQLIAKVAPTDSTVLITGETGTGKDVAARAIHQASPRKDQAFVPLNCGAIPETLLESELFGYQRGAFTGADQTKRGLFEAAGKGTILLNEIGETPTAIQPKLLHALEKKEIFPVGSTTPVRISARILAATHRDLRQMVDAGQFRADLYYRLNVFEIHLPPLRERPQDIRPIATHLLDQLCRSRGVPVPAIEPDALRALEQYRWPGNVRELSNVLERALILNDGPRIRIADLPGILTASEMKFEADLRVARAKFEKMHIENIIRQFDGDKKRAAEALGIDLSWLYRKLEETGYQG